MSSRISPADLEQLSAYLDEGLSARAKTQLEARLAAEPSLAAALNQVRLTRAMLRRAPQRRVPRSFVLSRKQASQPAKSFFGSWNSFNFASALASLLLVFTLIGDFTVNGLPVFARSAEAPQAMMLEATTAEDAAGAAAPSEEPFVLEAPAENDEYREAPMAKSGSSAATFFANYSAQLEAGLASVALVAGLVAIHLRRPRR